MFQLHNKIYFVKHYDKIYFAIMREPRGPVVDLVQVIG